MKNLKLKLAVACLLILGFFGILGVVGDYDYCEQIILNMTQEQYDYVKDTLQKKNGFKPTEREIAHWWADHHLNAE